jgi:hypothetical protein
LRSEHIEDHVCSSEINRFHTLKSEVLEELGNIWSNLDEEQESLKNMTAALQNYREYFGDIYNIECALLLEKIGILNRKRNPDAYYDSVELVLKILKTEYGIYHKDILRLSNKKRCPH